MPYQHVEVPKLFTNLNRVAQEVLVLEQLPPQQKTPLILTGPWTRGAREIVLQRELREFTERFVDSANQNRMWEPWGVPKQAIKENREMAHQLTPPTRQMMEMFAKIELRVGAYTELGMRMVADGMSRMAVATRWGYEEDKHGIRTMDVMVHAGIITEAQRIQTERDAPANPWRPEEHRGLGLELGYLGYGAGQELETADSYDKLVLRIRRDYGLPDQPTDIERARGFQTGAAAYYTEVKRDERAHHGAYVQMVGLYSRYRPDDMYEALDEVQRGFHMPMVELLADSMEVLQMLYDTPLEAARSYRGNFIKVGSKIGLQDRKALQLVRGNLKSYLDPNTVPDVQVLKSNGSFEPYRELVAAL